MAALSLHHAIFANEKDSDLPLRSAASFLHSVPERDESPTSQLFTSAAYQDLIQRQPTHPDGPRLGWDLGLNLLGDPISPAEHKSLEDHQTKMKLRRLHATNFTLELLFGIWGLYITIRYCLASADGLGDTERVCALALGIMSALLVAFVIISIMMPLFPQQGHPHVWRYTRSLFRGFYLLFLSAGAVMNLVLVVIWRPSHLCSWDVDIAWHTSAANTTTSSCHPASFVAWTVAALLRVTVTLAMTLLFIYTLRSYYDTRYPNANGNRPTYSPYFSYDPEDVSPVSLSSPPRPSKSTFRFTRSEDSSRTLNQSIMTLPKSNSISTLAPSTSCTGHSRSHSIPSSKDTSPSRISPPTSRRTSGHATNHGSPVSPFGSETTSQTSPAHAVIPSSQVLRRTSRVSLTRVTSDTVPSGVPMYSEKPNGPMTTPDPSEIRSSASWKFGHRGSGVHLDHRKTSLVWEKTHVHHASQHSVSLESSSSTHDDGESNKEKDKDDDARAYSYGYGASGSTYPYLDMYNPQSPGRYSDRASSSCEDVDEHGFSQGYHRVIPVGRPFHEATSEPRSSPSKDALEDEEDESSEEEEEYVAMMGGFVRRMATIESLGSKEAAGTLSPTGSVALRSMRSKTPLSQFSSVRLAEQRDGSTCASSLGVPSSTQCSLSTAYLSFSSGGTGMRVNERGELVPSPNANRSTSSLPQYYTAPSSDG